VDDYDCAVEESASSEVLVLVCPVKNLGRDDLAVVFRAEGDCCVGYHNQVPVLSRLSR